MAHCAYTTLKWAKYCIPAVRLPLCDEGCSNHSKGYQTDNTVDVRALRTELPVGYR